MIYVYRSDSSALLSNVKPHTLPWGQLAISAHTAWSLRRTGNLGQGGRKRDQFFLYNTKLKYGRRLIFYCSCSIGLVNVQTVSVLDIFNSKVLFQIRNK